MLPYQLAVASRAIAAILGCYGLASAAAACLGLAGAGRRRGDGADAVLRVLRLRRDLVFATRNAWRAWGGILIPTAALSLLYLAGRVAVPA